MRMPAAILLISVSLFFLFAPHTHAEDAVWKTTYGGGICPVDYAGAPRCTAPGIWQPTMRVTYHTQVTNADTGAIIACGSSVPQGTRVAFSFVPHDYTDIYWFATGRYFDSPYGDWVAQAATPGWSTICAKKNNYASFTDSGRNFNSYASLSVNPPSKTLDVAGNADCTLTADGVSKICTANSVGSFNGTFNFASTIGHFWMGEQETKYPENGPCNYSEAAFKQPGSIATPLGGGYWKNNGPYVLNVPKQTISCVINVEAPVGNPAAAPELHSGGACTVGTAQSISMISTDPDGDTLRYGVDWDANGTIDQWIPVSGYVASGSTQSASRTYLIAGSKTVKVMVQDQHGNNSGWSSLTFNCADSATAGLNAGDGLDNSGNNGGGVFLNLPDADLRVIPSLVHQGDTTKVNWSSTNVKSCTVQGQNGDSWSGLISPLGGQTSKPITGETTYMLTCLTDTGNLTKQATVRVIPTFEEK